MCCHPRAVVVVDRIYSTPPQNFLPPAFSPGQDGLAALLVIRDPSTCSSYQAPSVHASIHHLRQMNISSVPPLTPYQIGAGCVIAAGCVLSFGVCLVGQCSLVVSVYPFCYHACTPIAPLSIYAAARHQAKALGTLYHVRKSSGLTHHAPDIPHRLDSMPEHVIDAFDSDKDEDEDEGASAAAESTLRKTRLWKVMLRLPPRLSSVLGRTQVKVQSKFIL